MLLPSETTAGRLLHNQDSFLILDCSFIRSKWRTARRPAYDGKAPRSCVEDAAVDSSIASLHTAGRRVGQRAAARAEKR